MKDNDIIKNIRDLYNIKAPDIRGNLDFSSVEIVPPPKKNPSRRYIYAAAVYAAACIIVIAILPLLIGKDRPVQPDPSNNTVNILAGDSGEDTKKSEPDTLPAGSETVAPESADATETDDVPVTTPYDKPITEPEESFVTTPQNTTQNIPVSDTKAPETPKPLAQKYSKTYAKQFTTKNSGEKSVIGYTCSEYLDVNTPMYKITFWKTDRVVDGKVYYTRYDYTFNANTGKIVGKKITEKDSSFKSNTYERYHPQNSIPYGSFCISDSDIYNVCAAVNSSLVKIKSRTELLKFMNTINQKVQYSSEFNSSVYRLMNFLDSYGEEFFEENIMYIHLDIQSSGSISYNLKSVTVENGTLNLKFTSYTPDVIDCLMSGDVFVFTFARDDLAGVKNDVKISVSENSNSSSGNDNSEKPSPTMSKVYPDPASSIKMRFFRDKELTDEYKSTADIPYGAKVYYKVECAAGYIRTNLKLNVLRGPQLDIERKDGTWQHYYYFINCYSGDKLEYSCTAVLAGDSDGNCYYDMRDADTIRKYIKGDTETLWRFGKHGYSEKLDYDCNGMVNENDITGVLDEINGKETQRRAPSEDFYNGAAGTDSYLLNIDSAVVLPHGKVYVEGAYAIYKSRASIVSLPKEVYEKYDDDFFSFYDLAVIYCFTKDNTAPTADELKELWCKGNSYGATLTPVYKNEVGSITNEYAIYVGVPKTAKIEAIIPV